LESLENRFLPAITALTPLAHPPEGQPGTALIRDLNGLTNGAPAPDTHTVDAFTGTAAAGNAPGGVGALGLSDDVLSFALANLGTTVGDGECWTLAHEALVAAGADTSGDADCVWGSPVGLDAVMPGDVLQFEGVHFAGLLPGGGTYWQDFPHHTAIVYAVDGNQITLLNQNVNGDRTVQFTTINLGDWQTGAILAYRPQLP
jgi:hypothetical protein